MPTFNEALERAKARLSTEPQLRQSEAERLRARAASQRRVHEIAYTVGSAIAREVAWGTNPRWPREERSVVDQDELELIRPGDRYTDNDIFHRQHSGWVLCERVYPNDRAVISYDGRMVGITYNLRLKGLLLTAGGQVFSYAKAISSDYPRRSGVNAWGEHKDDIFAEGYGNEPGSSYYEAQIIGNVALIPKPAVNGSDILAHDASIRAMSGSLELVDLLAGVAVRYGIDPVSTGLAAEQF